MATTWPSGWIFNILVTLHYNNTTHSFEWDKTDTDNLLWDSPGAQSMNITNMVWYVDSSYTIPLYEGMDMYQYVQNYNEYSDYSTGTLALYGRIEIPPMKVLTESGVKALYNLLSLQDYPNNDVLMAVISAIDETKLDSDGGTFKNGFIQNAGIEHGYYREGTLIDCTIDEDCIIGGFPANKLQALIQGTPGDFVIIGGDGKVTTLTITKDHLPMDDIYNEIISRLSVAEEATF